MIIDLLVEKCAKYQDLTNISTHISLTFSRKITNVIYFQIELLTMELIVSAPTCLLIFILRLVS